ncbi:MAG: sugar phosphate isomerase/epimerase family protein [Magnetospiraceae bacterium]
MSFPFSLAFLTTAEVPPAEAVKIAAAAGYDMVGLRLMPAAPTEPDYSILTDPAEQRDVLDALTNTGIQLADIEIVRLKPETDVAQFRGFCDLGQKLGARNVLVAGDDTDHSRLTDTFAAFAALAAQFNLTADLEFMPWTGVKTLNAARAIVEAAGQPNGGVLVDALHFDRSASTVEDLAALPNQLIHYAQLCDGPVPYDPSDAGLIDIARGARLLPGDGGIDLKAMVKALPMGTPLSIEIPQVERARTVPPLQRAQEALAAAKTVVAQALAEAG